MCCGYYKCLVCGDEIDYHGFCSKKCEELAYQQQVELEIIPVSPAKKKIEPKQKKLLS